MPPPDEPPPAREIAPAKLNLALHVRSRRDDGRHDIETLFAFCTDGDRLSEDSRLVGSFRAHGLLVPVWDLPVGTGSDALEEPAAAFADRLEEALADSSTLSEGERSARSGLANRQITIR